MNERNDNHKCWHCSRSIAAEDAFCRFCGRSQQGQTTAFRHTHAGIIILTLILGPIALPFIWQSPKLSRNGRIGYFVFNLLISILMFWSVFGIYNNINRQFQDTMKLIEQTGMGTSTHH